MENNNSATGWRVRQREMRAARRKEFARLARQNPKIWRAYALSQFTPLSRDEVAERLGVGHRPRTISEWVKRAKEILRARLRRPEDY